MRSPRKRQRARHVTELVEVRARHHRRLARREPVGRMDAVVFDLDGEVAARILVGDAIPLQRFEHRHRETAVGERDVAQVGVGRHRRLLDEPVVGELVGIRRARVPGEHPPRAGAEIDVVLAVQPGTESQFRDVERPPGRLHEVAVVRDRRVIAVVRGRERGVLGRQFVGARSCRRAQTSHTSLQAADADLAAVLGDLETGCEPVVRERARATSSWRRGVPPGRD